MSLRNRVLVVLGAFLVMVAACTEPDDNGDATDLDLLMAATFGVDPDGSYSRYDEPDVVEWRTRHEFPAADFTAPPIGYGECMMADQDPLGDDVRMSLFSLRTVYLFQDGQPLDGNLNPVPRPVEVIGDLERGPSLQPIPVNNQEEPTIEQFIGDVNDLLTAARERGMEPVLALDFVLAPTMAYGSGSDDPTPVPGTAESQSLTEAAAAYGGEGKIWVADYGLPAGADDSEWPDNLDGLGQQNPPVAGEPITPQYGHGLMVGSVAAQAAPNSDVTVIDVTEETLGGQETITVSSIDNALVNAGVFRFGPSVLNLSLGFYDCDVVRSARAGAIDYRGSMAEAMAAVLEPYIMEPGISVVAAAGNDKTDQPFFPAALPGVTGIAASDTTVINTSACLVDELEAWSPASDAEPSCRPDSSVAAPFSNQGDNAQELRPGVDMVVHYPLLGTPIEYNYLDYGDGPVPLDTGKVRISGTSLAAPLYAACLGPGGSPAC